MDLYPRRLVARSKVRRRSGGRVSGSRRQTVSNARRPPTPAPRRWLAPDDEEQQATHEGATIGAPRTIIISTDMAFASASPDRTSRNMLRATAKDDPLPSAWMGRSRIMASIVSTEAIARLAYRVDSQGNHDRPAPSYCVRDRPGQQRSEHQPQEERRDGHLRRAIGRIQAKRPSPVEPAGTCPPRSVPVKPPSPSPGRTCGSGPKAARGLCLNSWREPGTRNYRRSSDCKGRKGSSVRA